MQVRSERLARQRLSRPASSAHEVVHDLCGLQAQDLNAARIGVWARTTGLTAALVEGARVEDRSIVRTWAMRSTLHLLAAEDVGWIRRLLLPGHVAGGARRSRQLGLDEATYSRAMSSLAARLPGRSLTRAQLFDELAADGIDASGQRMPHLLARASMEGLICEGPLRGGKPGYVLIGEWLGPYSGPLLDHDEAARRLAGRYLAAYAPATAEDFAAWSGLPLKEARAAMAGLEPPPVVWSTPPLNEPGADVAALEPPPVGGFAVWSGLPAYEAGFKPSTVDIPEVPELLLLPAFDTCLLGYRDRSAFMDPAHAKRVNAGGGMVKPVLLIDGMVAGTWARTARGIEVDMFDGSAPPGGAETLEASLWEFLS